MAVMERTDTELVRRLQWKQTDEGRQSLVWKEWLVTNGLGGYASGTVAGPLTRRYHGLLIAALPTPFGRTMMFNSVWERLRWPDGRMSSLPRVVDTHAGKEFDSTHHLVDFHLEAGLPVWTYDVDGVRFEKRVLMPHLQNTTHISYRLLSREPIRLELRPLVAFRLHEAPVNHPVAAPYALHAYGDQFEIVPGAELPPLRLFVHGQDKAFTVVPESFTNIAYTLEDNRGYEAAGDLWTPGYFRLTLGPDAPGTLVASTESWETIGALSPSELPEAERSRRTRLIEAAKRVALNDAAAELVLAADQFIITPAGRVEEAARARAAGDEVRTVIAGYHWFTDWGRDTMISLEGLTLCTGRQREAGYILRTFGHYVHDGLIPNMFPEGTKEGLYHTADATLWFFHAIHRYMAATRRSLDVASTAPEVEVDLRASRARHTVRHRRRSERRPREAGRGGLSAHVDGREGRRLGGDARGEARRSRSTRSGTTRCACSATGCARKAIRWRHRSRSRPSARANRSTRASGTTTAVTCTTWSTANKVPTLPVVRIRSWPSRWIIPCSIACGGSRCSISSAIAC
jgi:glycogen debranching enzyme